MAATPEPLGPIQSYDSDHTALVHVLWSAKSKGLSLDDADHLAEHIMTSRWMRAVRLHAVDESAGVTTEEDA